MLIPDYKILFESLPGQFMILSPDLHIMTVSNAYANATLIKREDVAGKHLFQVFPDNPDDPAANGVQNLKASLNKELYLFIIIVLILYRAIHCCQLHYFSMPGLV